MSLTLGDGLEWLSQQPSGSLDGIFTDPPWGISDVQIAGQESWKGLLAVMLELGSRVVKPEGWVLVWYGMPQVHEVAEIVLRSRYRINDIVFAAKRHSIVLVQPILCLCQQKRANVTATHVIHAHDTLQDTDHPAQRPVDAVARILKDWFKPGDKIADPFAGSNTTGYAARRLGIECHSFEINPVMYQTAIDREKQVDLFLDGGGTAHDSIGGGVRETPR